MILMEKKLLGRFTKTNCKKTNQEEYRIEKGDKSYAKWKGYNNSFNSWIDKKDMV